MTWIFWDAFFLISGSLFTFGAGPNSSAVVKANISVDTNSTAAPNAPTSSSGTASDGGAATTNIPAVRSSVVLFGGGERNATIVDVVISINATSATAPDSSASSASTVSSRSDATKRPVSAATNHPTKKFVAAAVRSHFDDCPDSHQHFCFHGTCRFLILEETPACVCHAGFVGMRCEHADLLAVVATNHRQQTVATVLVLCVIGSVLIMVLCSLLHCWWRQDCRRRSPAHHYAGEKHGASHYPSESMV
ncbi:protransforming growth factor alpha [Cololabis saira]|uniref:protransforming growth factor alpha n=1 Tax=Cololabis saira TaxID=129043 RepID=UPI002AD4B5A0|nr:protransforming growth factor alpha [Cololabis saira]